MATLTQYISRLNEDYLRDPKNRIWNVWAKERAVNKWYTKVQQELWWNADSSEQYDTRNAVAGSELYDLPDDFVRLSLVRYDNDELIRTTRKAVREFDETPQRWEPHWYYIYNGKLGLYPIPDSNKQIDLYYYESNVLSDTQASELPAYCDDAITLWAAYKLFLWVRDQQSAFMFRQDFEEEIKQIQGTMLYNDENMRFWYEKGQWLPQEDVLYF